MWSALKKKLPSKNHKPHFHHYHQSTPFCIFIHKWYREKLNHFVQRSAAFCLISSLHFLSEYLAISIIVSIVESIIISDPNPAPHPDTINYIHLHNISRCCCITHPTFDQISQNPKYQHSKCENFTQHIETNWRLKKNNVNAILITQHISIVQFETHTSRFSYTHTNICSISLHYYY